MKIIEMVKAFFCAKYEKAVKPICGNDEELTAKEILLVKKELRGIPNYYLFRHIGRNNISLYIYLLGIKFGKIPQFVSETCSVKVGGKIVAKLSQIPIYIHFLHIKDNRLIIEGNTLCPKCLEQAYGLAAESSGEFYELSCQAENNIFFEGNSYESKKYFKFELDLHSETEIIFFNMFNGKKIPCSKINVFRFSPVSDIIKYQYCVLEDWMVYISGSGIVVKKAEETAVEKREMMFRNELYNFDPERAKWAIGLRENYFENKKRARKPIWLCMDRTASADDNAKIFFRYIQRYDDIESYFVISDKSRDYEEMKKIGKVVNIYSEEHYRLTLIADYMISSQANGAVENPFWENAEMFRDLYHHPKLIFLQHGVIKDDMSPTLNRFNTNFTGFITSTESERNSILSYSYGYSENEVWLTGLPRFDELYNAPRKYILIMPSWRKGIMSHVWDEGKHDMVWKVAEDFEESQYFKRYHSLMNSKKLELICREYGYKISFMPHPLMKEYGERFAESSIVELWNKGIDYQTAFAYGSLLITDYSSVAFDFAYLKKPILYYQFDAEEFYANHTYRKGYFDYEKDGFGEVVCTEGELIDLICEYAMSDMALKEKYRSRIEKTFKYGDKNNCERIYRILKSKGKENRDEFC